MSKAEYFNCFLHLSLLSLLFFEKEIFSKSKLISSLIEKSNGEDNKEG